jgi:hypothetical protein
MPPPTLKRRGRKSAAATASGKDTASVTDTVSGDVSPVSQLDSATPGSSVAETPDAGRTRRSTRNKSSPTSETPARRRTRQR